MARIPEDEIERLKREIAVERLAVAKGVELKRHGKDLVGKCPFHDDRTPSLVITPEKNVWHCLGACQAGGSVIDWVMRAEGVSFRLAVELLREDSPSLAAALPAERRGRQQGPVPKKSTTPKLATLERNADDDVLMRQVVDYYHATLKESPEALTYLQRRGLVSGEMIERFKLGFANRTLAYRLPSKNRKVGDELRGQLQRIGILRESGHEHMTGSLVIPVFDEAGRVTEMYGRKITPGLRPGTPMHLYLPGPHEGVWNAPALGSSKQVILCEALIDALTFWCAGFRCVTASYGVEGFTDDHMAAFRKHGTEQVLIAYDRDDAGDRAAAKLGETLMAEGIECFRVLFPRGMDANDYARKMTPAPKTLELVLRQAQWMGRGTPKPVVVEPPVTAMPLPPTSPTPMTNEDPEEAEPKPEIAAEPIVVVGETKTIIADADGVVIEEIEHAVTERPKMELDGGRGDGRLRRDALDPHPSLVAALPAAAPPAPEPELLDVEPVLPAAPTTKPTTTATTTNDEVIVKVGDRRWRVRGLAANTKPELMKVNVLVSREGAGFHVDALDLYSARQRAQYTTLASTEIGVEERVVKKDLGELLLKLEELRDKGLSKEPETKQPKLSDEEQQAALALLRDPKLLERILDDFDKCGVVGERTNKLVGYLAATSRKLDAPLAVVIQSSSAAGKSSLMDAVLNLMPEEERTQYSAMTGQSLFYMGEADIQHKILAIVEEEGAERASYALKLLQSEGELTIASTGKDPATGRLVTQEYRVEGPVMIFLTTTAIEVDEELLNRCIVLSVDEGREQTRAIHARQRTAQTLEGVLGKHEKEHLVKVHRDAQRLLRPLLVVNPHAHELSFLDTATRTRRDHMKYLTLIKSITLLHQYQRPVKTTVHRGQTLRYVEVTKEDIALANRLCHDVLGRSLDELPPQTRRLLGLIDEMVTAACTKLGVDREDYRFTRRDVRDHSRWGNTQTKIHLGRLIEMEYVIVHRGRQGQGFLYELAYNGEGKDGTPFLPGLAEMDEASASTSTTSTSRGSEADFAGGGRGVVGPWSGGGRGAESSMEGRENGSMVALEGADPKNARHGMNGASPASYVEVVRAAVVEAG